MSNTHATPLAALIAYAAQKPRLEFGNYGNASAYQSEARRIRADLRRVESAVLAFDASGATSADLIESARGGRLDIVGTLADGYRIEYTTGQYWPTEYRPAVARVLEGAARLALQRKAAANPPHYPAWAGMRELDMGQIQGLNEEIGQTWFSRGNRRFFGTKLVSRVAKISGDGARAYFVTSEQPPHGERRYSVRYATISVPRAGHIATAGEFCQYLTGRDASAALRQYLAEG